MDNFVEVVGLDDLLNGLVGDTEDRNFEAVFSRLYEADPSSSIVTEIEARVRSYFEAMELPPTPTIYDYLILSLRPKDLIATFNWDPFLYQAFCRNKHVGGSPLISFLHGTVSLGFSEEDDKAGPAGRYSRETGAEFVPTRLLYPVAQKDYNSDRFIWKEWRRLRAWMEHAKRVTIFGYGAPATDVEAVSLLSDAWGDPNERNMEQFEIIDIAPDEVVTERWSRFIHSHHYDYCNSYFDSVLAHFPRRSGERFIHQFLPSTPGEAFQEPNPVPRHFSTLEEMHQWFQPLIKAEQRSQPRSPGT